MIQLEHITQIIYLLGEYDLQLVVSRDRPDLWMYTHQV